MEKNEEWGTVEAPQKETEETNKVEYEIEGDPPSSEEPKQAEPEKKEVPELEGIETKGAQKRIRQLIKQRKDKEDQVNALIKQNEELQKLVKDRESAFTEVSQKNLTATEKQLNDKIEMARSSYLEAFEGGDKEKLLRSQEMLNEAQTDLKTLSVTKEKLDTTIKQKPVAASQPQQQQQYQQPAPDIKAQEWAAQNTWFGKDNIMSAAALAIDAELKAEGYNTQDDEFYQEIDRRIRETFPQKFTEDHVPETRQQGTPSRPAQVVAGASRSAPNPKKVKLSQSDLRLAEKWNIPIEQYAQEKMKADHAEGGYTNVNMKRGG